MFAMGNLKLFTKAIFLTLVLGSTIQCTTRVKDVAVCKQSLSRDKLDSIISAKVHLQSSDRIEVKRIKCDYYITVWPKVGPPDSEVFLLVRSDGKVLQRDNEVFQ